VSDRIKEDEIGGVCRMHKRLEMHTKFKPENLTRTRRLENLVVDGVIILK
jgi:hypothetical protein